MMSTLSQVSLYWYATPHTTSIQHSPRVTAWMNSFQDETWLIHGVYLPYLGNNFVFCPVMLLSPPTNMDQSSAPFIKKFSIVQTTSVGSLCATLQHISSNNYSDFTIRHERFPGADLTSCNIISLGHRVVQFCVIVVLSGCPFVTLVFSYNFYG